MPSASQFLKSVAVGVVKHGAGLLVRGLPLGETLLSVARDAFDDYRRRQKEATLRAEIQALAQETAAEIRRQVSEAVAEAAGDQPPEARQALEGYLLQIPAAVRQTLRRPADPTGTTVPAGLTLSRAEDLIPLLPTRLPRFRPGNCPPGLGDWELVELLGVGGFGEVWKAHNPHLKQWAALKFCIDAQAARSLRTETDLLARVMAGGRHPGIVQLLDTYLSADPPCLKYEFVEGGDLAGLIREWHRSATPPTPTQAAKVMRRLAEAVGHAHRLRPGIVHRDLKPANILVSSDGDGGYMFKVADFGIGGLAAEQELARVTRQATSRGEFLATAAHGSYTPLYASPQQVRGDKPDPRDDVYSLGVIWYQLLTGDLGSGAPTGMRWAEPLRQRGMSEDAVQLLASCFEASPEHRPADAAELADRLGRLPELTPPRPAAPPPVVPLSTETKPAPQPVPKPRPAEKGQRAVPARVAPADTSPPVKVLLAGLVLAGIVAALCTAYNVYFARDTEPLPKSAPPQKASTPGHDGRYEIAVKVTFDGQPLANVTMAYYRPDSTPDGKRWVAYNDRPTSADGIDRIALFPGTYRVTVSSSSLAAPKVYADPEKTPLTLTVPGPSYEINLSSNPGQGVGGTKTQ